MVICPFCWARHFTRLRPMYMVKRHLWKRLGNGRGYVCHKCFETRLGRKLTSRDLIDAPVNEKFLRLLRRR